MVKKVGIVGLGRCGMPATEKFIKAGYQVFGYARRPEVIARFKNIGGIHVEDPAAVARNADTVIIMVLNDPQVIEVITASNGILQGVGKNSMVIGMSTINRENQESLARQCNEKGVAFVDSPFTGGPARITAGTSTLIVAAPSQLVERARPFLEVIGKIHHVGESVGMGQSVKHCNQLLVCVTHAGVVEVILMAKKLGLNPTMVCDIVGSGIGGSDYFRLLSRSIIEHVPSPGGLGQLAKDIGIVINTARNLRLPLYTATSAHQYFQAALSQGFENADGGDLMTVVEHMTEQWK
ncbi:MAG: NAD(P)-dependent oxidoreductase [Thermodesulfobacteriota bacterium]